MGENAKAHISRSSCFAVVGSPSWSCAVALVGVGNAAAPSLSLFGTGRNVRKVRMEEEGVGGVEVERGFPPKLHLTLRLFGEFADDADQRSVLVLQTLVVRSQVH